VPPLEPETAPPDGAYLAYLDVWERHISALEDAAIREVALGGPDTTTRTQIVWQVKLLHVEDGDGGEGDGALNCASAVPGWDELTAPSSGQMNARAEPTETETDPCIVPARAGYRGLENQLYRVEVHRVLSADEITIKWSRENGSVVVAWTGQDSLDPNKLTVGSTGRDEVLGLAADDWIELTDDRRELRGQPGTLVRITNVVGNVLTIDPGGTTITRPADGLHPKVRRWDMPRDVGEITVDLTVADNWIELEDGVQVQFAPGVYRSGDYWWIPARTATRDIEWPRDPASAAPLPQPPNGIRHSYCRLALLSFDGETWTRRSDCRSIFPPLTEMVHFFQVGGDGQEAMPNQLVPQALEVGVLNGQTPVEEARVRFRIIAGTGGQLQAGASSGNEVVVTSGPDGIYACSWRLGTTPVGQQVEATLLEIDGKPLLATDGNPLLTPLHFNANLSIASQVAYDPRNCPPLQEADARTVQEAIDVLCQTTRGGCCTLVGEGGEYARLDEALQDLLAREKDAICICLLPGEHTVADLDLSLPPERAIAVNTHITIHGCGQGSRLFLEGRLQVRGVRSFTLRDVALDLVAPAEGERGTIEFDRCSEVTVASCHVAGFTAGVDDEFKGALVSVANTDRVIFDDNVFTAAALDSFERVRNIFEIAEADFLMQPFDLPNQGQFLVRDFEQLARKAVQVVSDMNRDERQQLQGRIGMAVGELRGQLNTSELFSMQKLLFEMSVAEPAVDELFDALLDIRRVAIKSHGGVAVILGAELFFDDGEDIDVLTLDSDDSMTLNNNQINGILALYGLPPSIAFMEEVFNANLRGLLEEQLRGGQIALRESGFLGTLFLRGNQIARVALSAQVFQRLLAILQGQAEGLFGLFNRCLVSDNVFEGSHNWFMGAHQSMTSNAFPMVATRFRGDIGFVIADTAIYVGNHAGDPDWVLDDISRNNSRAANLEIAIG